MIDLERCWTLLCPVDVTDAVRWLESSPQSWPVVAANKPQRIFGVPSQLDAAVRQVCGLFDVPVVVHSPMLSRILPGTHHAMHADNQRPDWLTRIHIPLITNDGCWLSFEDEYQTLTTRLARGDMRACAILPVPFVDEVEGRRGEVVELAYDGEYTVGTVRVFNRVHFEVGYAYTFNTLKRHAFGNEGESVRIHFLFDVLRKDD